MSPLGRKIPSCLLVLCLLYFWRSQWKCIHFLPCSNFLCPVKWTKNIIMCRWLLMVYCARVWTMMIPLTMKSINHALPSLSKNKKSSLQYNNQQSVLYLQIVTLTWNICHPQSWKVLFPVRWYMYHSDSTVSGRRR